MTAPLDPRVTPARAGVAAAHLRGTVEAAHYADGIRHRVRVPSVPLRREPRADLPFDTELLHGESFVVYDSDAEGWSWGQVDVDDYVGWLPTHALGAADPPAPTHTVAALRTFVYPAPRVRQPPSTALPFGAQLVVTGEEGAFARVADGYVWRGHLAPDGRRAADFVAVAETFLGTPYLWGGRTSLGLDCSALVQTALLACGRAAPRDSDMQERQLGTRIDPNGALRRGDLVFWRGHVGIMRDAWTLLHANGHTMSVAFEDFAAARNRIQTAEGSAVTCVRRLDDQ